MEITKKVDMLVRDVIEENGYRLDEVLYEKEGSMMFLRLIIDKVSSMSMIASLLVN